MCCFGARLAESGDLSSEHPRITPVGRAVVSYNYVNLGTHVHVSFDRHPVNKNRLVAVVGTLKVEV